MAQLLIRKSDGAICEIRSSGAPFTDTERISFVTLNITDRVLADLDQYNASWRSELIYEVLNHDIPTDVFTLRIRGNENPSGVGRITPEKVTSFLAGWNAENLIFGVDEIGGYCDFDLSVYSALFSANFWDVNISGVVFNETNYNGETGVHTLEIDFSAIGNNPTYIERYLIGRGAEIAGHSGRVVTCYFNRVDVRSEFQKDLDTDRHGENLSKKRYYISLASVATIESNGGTMDTTFSVAAGFVNDKLND